ncbi:hypothetical protein BV898_02053 [Hypsibius exemplaris]|uniref:Uncharacterized protein n=1 Tax=Hypsibius exemplaris TaxID=2072580 RepID=A0A1W0X9L7_HYPEX|nr:hypothetical protein BV898_02053 [Hypsibius exemplaris]
MSAARRPSSDEEFVSPLKKLSQEELKQQQKEVRKKQKHKRQIFVKFVVKCVKINIFLQKKTVRPITVRKSEPAVKKIRAKRPRSRPEAAPVPGAGPETAPIPGAGPETVPEPTGNGPRADRKQRRFPRSPDRKRRRFRSRSLLPAALKFLRKDSSRRSRSLDKLKSTAPAIAPHRPVLLFQAQTPEDENETLRQKRPREE